MIRPNKSGNIMLPAGENHVFALPKEYQSAHVLVEITGGGLTKAEAACANQLDVQVCEVATTRFSVLIMSDTHGATVKEVQPPKR